MQFDVDQLVDGHDASRTLVQSAIGLVQFLLSLQEHGVLMLVEHVVIEFAQSFVIDRYDEGTSVLRAFKSYSPSLAPSSVLTIRQ